MPNIIDRRLNSRDKNLTNRQKFLERAQGQIKKAVEDAIANGNIGDINSKKVNVPVKGINEPTFSHDYQTGNKQYVVPGNKDYVVGDTIDKPESGGGGSGGSKASNSGEGQDEFTFTLTKEEFLEYFFENLELPDLVKKQISDVKKESMKRAGYTTVGNPSQLDVKATTKQALGRRIALKRPRLDEIKELEKQIDDMTWNSSSENPCDVKLLWELTKKLEALKRKLKAVPWIDPIDTRYRLFVPQPMPITKALMVCMMDVSGSMGEREKTIAKKFFILLSILLHHKYDSVEIVFVRHHSEAEECTEHDFFYKRESGGTVVSSGLNLVNEILNRYPDTEYNKYLCQASDGDNWADDNSNVLNALDEMLPKLQYFAYLDIPNAWSGGKSSSDLWDVYKKVQDKYKHLVVRQATSEKDIWNVFKELFAKKDSTKND